MLDKDEIIRALMRQDSETPRPTKQKKLDKHFGARLTERPNKTASEKAKAAVSLKFNSESNNPEFGNDFRTAMIKVLAKMSENSEDPANEVLKLLVSGESQLNDEVNKVI